MYYTMEKETLPREALEQVQLRRLRDVCGRVYANVPFYRNRLEQCGITPADVTSLDVLRRLPFTEKQDLRDHYPYDLFAVPMENVVRIHASSGTTGKSIVAGYTRYDLDIWSEVMARSLCSAGVTRHDLVHVGYGYGLFTGGLGAHYGAELLGCTVIPASGGATKRQVHLMRDFRATVLCCTPSYALHLHDTGMELGIDMKKLPLRVGVFGAEPWSESMRADMENKMGLDALNIYGLSEITGPGVAMECLKAKQGMHIQEDFFLPEIIDPVSCEPLPPGSVGELVITTLTKEAMPLLRYRTRDLTSLDYTPCPCGRVFARITRIMGRSDDMLIIRGVNVFPQQIESLLMECEGITPHYQLVVSREGNLDALEVQVEFAEGTLDDADEVRKFQARERNIQKAIKEFLGVSAKVRLVAPRSIQRSEGKAVRIIDTREMT
ncbi:MAG: phenylacetate--CoA ligase [Deltaproteobacteria bacterium]|nr:phenylacetate--CoA ligase [Deltaproteobacteria bacterium]